VQITDGTPENPPGCDAGGGDDGSGCRNRKADKVNEAPFFEARTNLLSRAQIYAETEPGFARFLKAVTEATEPEDLATHSPEVLEQLWRQSYERLGRRGLASHETYFLPPFDNRHPEIIEVFSADMPFIVDSVLAAIRAKGGTVRFMSHPILIFDPATFRVLEQPAAGTRPESFLHIHIDPLPDVDMRHAMRREIDEVMGEVARVVAGWRPMLERLHKVIQSWHDTPPRAAPAARCTATRSTRKNRRRMARRSSSRSKRRAAAFWKTRTIGSCASARHTSK